MGIAIGVCVLATSGCGAARWIADGLADDPAPGTPDAGHAPGTAAPLPAPVEASDVADAVIGREPDASATRSTYVVSPALTWGELQLYRPYVITGELYQPRHRTPECSAESRPRYELTGQASALFAEQIVHAEHIPFGIGSTYLPLGSVISLDREVMADRAMRTGAYLVQRGPVCIGTLLEISFFGPISGHPASSRASFW